MTDVDVDEIKRVVEHIVTEASNDGSIEQLTPRMIRVKVEEKMDLEPGTLDAYKTVVKQAASDILNALDADQPPEEENKSRKKPAKTAQSTKNASSSGAEKLAKRKSKQNESGTPPAKKAKVASKPEDKKSSTKETTSKPRGKNGKAVRSASVISSGNEDEDGEERPSPKPQSKSKRPSLPKNTSAHDADVSTAEAAPPVKKMTEDNEEHEGEASKDKYPKSKMSESISANDIQAVDEADAKEKSDSEMSVLIDEPPKKAGRKKKDKATSSEPLKKRKAKEPVEESPDDLEIKRLKSFVVGCGVRKVWSKEFKDITEDKRAQIRRLKEILSGLGMAGRLSMEKAKAIKEKRELAQELEDVQSFEKAVVSGNGRPRRKAVPESSDGNESDVEDMPTNLKRKSNARQSIMAFLGDQSDSE